MMMVMMMLQRHVAGHDSVVAVDHVDVLVAAAAAAAAAAAVAVAADDDDGDDDVTEACCWPWQCRCCGSY